MLSCLNAVREACLSVTENVGHYEAMEKADKYCVWAEESEASSLQAENIKAGQTIRGTIDYFTKDDEDDAPDRFQKAFNDFGFSWTLNSVQYEDETRYIHYEWIFEVWNKVG